MWAIRLAASLIWAWEALRLACDPGDGWTFTDRPPGPLPHGTC